MWAGSVRIAVAANFTGAMKALSVLFEKETGHAVIASYGSTGTLYAQIINGAPYELFLAADSIRPEKLEKAGIAVRGSRVTYAWGELVLWSLDPNLIDAEGKILLTGINQRIVIANPKTAPYGLAGRQVLENMGLWERYQPRLVRGQSIAQVFQMIASGNVSAGFIAASQLALLPVDKKGSYWQPSKQLYSPLSQQAVLLKKGEAQAAAIAFHAFLQTAPAQSVISNYGYHLK